MRYPDDLARQFIDFQFNKIETLIKYRAWSVDLDRFNKWKSQFASIEDSYFAAYLLSRLAYFNRRDFSALIAWSFAECVRRVAMDGTSVTYTDESWFDHFEATRSRILVCPFAVDNPAASGNMVARLLRDRKLISERNLCSDADLEERFNKGSYSAVVFVDDIIGSGDQARNCYKKLRYTLAKIPGLKLLAVGLAPRNTIEILQSQIGIEIIAAELLTETNSTLEKNFWFKEDFEAGMAFLEKLQHNCCLPTYGYAGSTWAIAFEHGVPDVCSPFYRYHNTNWISPIPEKEEDV